MYVRNQYSRLSFTVIESYVIEDKENCGLIHCVHVDCMAGILKLTQTLPKRKKSCKKKVKQVRECFCIFLDCSEWSPGVYGCILHISVRLFEVPLTDTFRLISSWRSCKYSK